MCLVEFVFVKCQNEGCVFEPSSDFSSNNLVLLKYELLHYCTLISKYISSKYCMSDVYEMHSSLHQSKIPVLVVTFNNTKPLASNLMTPCTKNEEYRNIQPFFRSFW